MEDERVNEMRNKIILTDADGCLLDWTESFMRWIKEKNLTPTDDNLVHYDIHKKIHGLTINDGKSLVAEFNRSEELRNLKPIRDSVEYVNKLSNKGYQFHCITTIENREDIKLRRTRNLETLFGNVFIDVTCVGNNETKKHYLEKYSGSKCFWIEDHPDYAIDGHDLGLETILMTHDYNLHFNHPDIHIVHSWKQIYEIINEMH